MSSETFGTLFLRSPWDALETQTSEPVTRNEFTVFSGEMAIPWVCPIFEPGLATNHHHPL